LVFQLVTSLQACDKNFESLSMCPTHMCLHANVAQMICLCSDERFILESVMRDLRGFDLMAGK
jgi:hypothetical protein